LAANQTVLRSKCENSTATKQNQKQQHKQIEQKIFKANKISND